MQVDPADPASVLWLQQALAKLMPPGSAVRMGIYDSLTQKAVMNYQQTRNLPISGVADPGTVTKIEEELAALP